MIISSSTVPVPQHFHNIYNSTVGFIDPFFTDTFRTALLVPSTAGPLCVSACKSDIYCNYILKYCQGHHRMLNKTIETTMTLSAQWLNRFGKQMSYHITATPSQSWKNVMSKYSCFKQLLVFVNIKKDQTSMNDS